MGDSEVYRLIDKIIALVEKNITAWDRSFNLHSNLKDDIKKVSHDISDLKYLLEIKITNDEKFARFLKVTTGILSFIAVSISIGALIISKIK